MTYWPRVIILSSVISISLMMWMYIGYLIGSRTSVKIGDLS